VCAVDPREALAVILRSVAPRAVLAVTFSSVAPREVLSIVVRISSSSATPSQVVISSPRLAAAVQARG